MQQIHHHHISPPASPFRKIFVPWRLLAGLGLVIFGVLVLAAIVLFANRISLRDLILGAFSILLGIALMAKSRAQGCVGCKVPLDDTSAVFPIELTPHVQQAVGWSGHGNVDALLQLRNAPFANAQRMSAVLIDFCPSCRNVAQLATATNVQLPDGSSAHENISHRVTILGPAIGRVLDMVDHRNRIMYGGAASP